MSDLRAVVVAGFIAVAPVALRAVVLGRATTRRVVDVLPDCATDGIALRADWVVVLVGATFVAARAAVVRGTTRRVVVLAVVLVRAKTSIWEFVRDGVVPGFSDVRMRLFIYGYMLLYVFALT